MYGSRRAVALYLAVITLLATAQPVHRSLRHRHAQAEQLHAESDELAHWKHKLVMTSRVPPKGDSAKGSEQVAGNASVKPDVVQGERVDRYDKLGWLSLFTLFVLASCCGTFKLVGLITAYRSNLQGSNQTMSFSQYVVYSLETWFVKTHLASVKLMTLAFLLTVLVGSLLCGAIMEHKNPFTSLWYVSGWVLDPGSAFGLEDHHILAYFLSAALGICGILMLALLLALTQDWFNNSMDSLKKGHSPVMENGHIMIIGFTEQTPSLLQEMCQAHKASGGTVIVVFSDQCEKTTMDADIAAAEVQTMGSTIVTRCGKPHSCSDLLHVAASTARTIILLPRTEEEMDCQDAFTLRTLVVLRAQGWPCQGRIVAVCSMIRNMKLFQDVGGDVTDIVMVDSFIAKIMTRCSRHAGLSSTLNQIFSAGGSDFLINSVPKHLDGKEFCQAYEYYPGAVPVGVITNGETEAASVNHTCHMCPSADFVLQEGQELVFIASDSAGTLASGHAVLSDAADSTQKRLRRDRVGASPGVPETIVMLGWNELACNMILELDEQVATGTELIVVAEVSKEEREKAMEQVQVRHKKAIGKIRITHSLGRITSRFDLEDLSLPLAKISRIFLLASSKSGSSEHMDACTVTAILQVRDMLLESGVSKDIAIIPEIRDPLSRMMCKNLSVPDFIDTSGLPSKVLGMVAFQPRIQLVLNEIISQTGRANFSVQKLAVYMDGQEPRPACVSFQHVAAAVGACGDVAIGWSKPWSHSRGKVNDFGDSVEFHSMMLKMCTEVHGKSAMIEYELNPPDKLQERDWSWDDDKIVVLTSVGF